MNPLRPRADPGARRPCARIRRSRLLPGVRAADEVHEGQVWDEAQKLAGKDPDFHRRDLWEAIETGDHSSTPSDGTATGAGKTSRPSPPDADGRRAGLEGGM
ncbi:catalase [Sorangium sp. So ce296]|uniref:catalase n=1 Tax=Sorangium sp. So ce296 TaxID=3133296 RepID=UPI003F608343